MTLPSWLENGWLRRHKTSKKEIADLLKIVDRDLKDAAGVISHDWRFGIAYNAALKLCTILLNAEGYRPEKTLQHYRTIQALPLILGKNLGSTGKWASGFEGISWKKSAPVTEKRLFRHCRNN